MHIGLNISQANFNHQFRNALLTSTVQGWQLAPGVPAPVDARGYPDMTALPVGTAPPYIQPFSDQKYQDPAGYTPQNGEWDGKVFTYSGSGIPALWANSGSHPEDTLMGGVFTRAFVESVAASPATLIRFVKWHRVKDEGISEGGQGPRTWLADWSMRTQVADSNQGSFRGVAYEAMPYLCRLIGKIRGTGPLFASIIIPLSASIYYTGNDTFVRQMGALFHGSGVPISVALSNEMWNSEQQAGAWVKDQVGADAPKPKGEWIGANFGDTIHAFVDECPGARIAVEGTLLAPEFGEEIAKGWNAYFEAQGYEERVASFSCQTYFAVNLSDWNGQSEPSVQDMLDAGKVAITGRMAEMVRQNKAVADSLGVPLTSYEGGKSYIARGDRSGVTEQTKATAAAAQDDPGMKDLYILWLQTLADNGMDSVNPFHHCSNTGSWTNGWFALTHDHFVPTPSWEGILEWAAANAT